MKEGGGGCANSFYNAFGPTIDDFSLCANGILWAYDAEVNSHFDGLESYDLDLSNYSGAPGSGNSGLDLLKKFYGVTYDADWNEHYLLEKVDKEPDIFYFNFAGYSGKFVFDPGEKQDNQITIRTIPYQNFDIDYTTENHELTGFTIIDGNGNKFIFDIVEKTTIVNRANPYSQPDDAQGLGSKVRFYRSSNFRKEYNSSWYLSEIVTSDDESILFNYEKEYYQNSTRGPQQTGLYYSNQFFLNDDKYDPNNTSHKYHYTLLTNKTIIDGHRLSSIESDNVLVEFDASTIRADLESEPKLDFSNLILNSSSLSVFGDNLQNMSFQNLVGVRDFDCFVGTGSLFDTDNVEADFEITDLTLNDGLFSGYITLTDFSSVGDNTLGIDLSDFLDDNLDLAHPIEITLNGGLVCDSSNDENNANTTNEYPPKAIDGITIYSKHNGLKRIKKYQLNQGYFESTVDEDLNNLELEPQAEYFRLTDDPIKYFNRLRLESIQEFGKTDSEYTPPYSFEYKYSDFTGDDNHRLPWRLSYQRDIWGYYNGASGNNTLIPEIWVYPDEYDTKDSRQFRVIRYPSYSSLGRREYNLLGADRLPNDETFDIGLLTKINYPTGGFTEYDYEMHSYLDEYSLSVSGFITTEGGGARIKTVTKSSGADSDNDIIYNYSYYDGHVINKPVFAVRDLSSILYSAFNDDTEKSYDVHTTRYSIPRSNMESTNGSFVGYRKVEESMSGNGKTEYRYSMPGTYFSDSDNLSNCDLDIDGHCDGFYSITQTHDILYSTNASDRNPSNFYLEHNPSTPRNFPFAPNSNYDWQRGHLLSSKVYDNSEKLVQESLYEYGNYMPEEAVSPVSVYGIKLSHHYPVKSNKTSISSGFAFRGAKYALLTDVAKTLVKETSITYDLVDDEDIAIIKNYQYSNPHHKVLTKISTFKSNGDLVESNSIYPSNEDLTTSEISESTRLELIDRNKVEMPIKSEVFVNGELIDGIINKYEVDEHGNPVVGTVEKLNLLTKNYEVNIEEIQYSPAGKIQGYLDRSGLYNTIIWSYNNTYPIAEISNASISDIESVIGSIDQYNDFSPGDSDIESLSNTLRSNFPNALITTYTYEPLVGMTSQTDANGKSLYYHYDDLNRLDKIEDNEGNTLKEYSYNYKD